MSEKPHFHGHRQRLKERFKAGGKAALADYELLELLLMQALPRKDVKPIAKNLLTKYGSINKVISAPITELAAFNGLGEGSALHLKVTEAIGLAAKRERTSKVNLNDRLELLDYLYAKMSDLKHEEFHVIFLDSKNNLLADEKMFNGTIDSSAVYPREIIKAALKHSAANIVAVHNHPSGDASPSKDDEMLTYELFASCKSVDVNLLDHIVIGDGVHYSFADDGKI